MRKVLLHSVVALSAIAAFMSCSKDIESSNASAIENKQKNDYASSFVAKYGPIDPNQSWDFTTGAKLGAVTRTVDNSSQGATQIQTNLVNGLNFNRSFNSPSWYSNSLYNTQGPS